MTASLHACAVEYGFTQEMYPSWRGQEAVRGTAGFAQTSVLEAAGPPV